MTSPIRERYHLTFPASKVQRSSRRGRKVSIDIGDVVVGRRTVLIALDETGDEEFSKREVFGFGGVIGFGGAIRHAEKIWRGMKARDFGGEDQPVHATTRWSQQQLDAISTFFRRSRLGRFAFVLRRPPLTMGSINALDVLKPVMLRQLMQALADTPILPDRIVVMFEKSDRLLPKVMEELRGIGIKGGGKQIPLTWLFSHKLPPKPMLEMADHVAHRAQRHLLDFRKGIPIHPEFDAVFPARRVPYAHYRELGFESVSFGEDPKTTISFRDDDAFSIQWEGTGLVPRLIVPDGVRKA